MDNTQLTTIAVTAVISVIAKEVVTWLIALVKKTAATATIRAKARAVFRRINFLIFMDLCAIAAYVNWLVQVGWDDSPLSGKAALIMIGCVLGIIAMIGLLFSHINDATTARTLPKTKAPPAP